MDSIIELMTYRDYYKIHEPFYRILNTPEEQTVKDYIDWCKERNVEPKRIPAKWKGLITK